MQVALNLFGAGEFTNSVDVTQASLLAAASEQAIILKTQSILSGLNGIGMASDLVLEDPSKPNSRESWIIPGTATQNATAKGRLQVNFLNFLQK